ncbi:hypothetical protein LVJ94_08935 [Pendulispora rubella]|uniref:Neurotransmitter-gated ion-channel ligand-binding domain-containing protein n=1 Tax=Pendulispora rubella TaxID=2741070 RepID=A0ABZ2L8T8_9BACT
MSRLAAIVQIVSLVIAFLGAIVILGAKVHAADKAPPPDKSPSSAAGKADAAVLDAGVKPAASAPLAAGVRDAGNPLDYAVLPGESDFDEHLSEEQKASIGEGKVPIHREGKFRSPFAHPRFGGPATAKVGLVINNVRGYDIQHGSFDADFFLSLTSDKPMGTMELFFTNGHEITQTVLADTPTFKAYRFTGSFISRVDLRKYPFDTQYLTIEFEDLRAGVDQIVFEPYQERTSLDAQFILSGWGVESIGARSYKHLYPPRFDRDDLYVSRYKFSLGIERFATSAAFSVFFPAYIIVLISLMGLWVRAERLDIRTNAVAPMLAAAVFFHYSLTQSLPSVGYLTRADKLMLGVYVALLINMLSTWSFLIIGEQRQETVFRWARAWVPPVTIALMLAVSWI